MQSQRLYPDAVYDGDADSQRRAHGVGCLRDDSQGLKYTGQLRRGLADGHGVLQLPGGAYFAGQFQAGAVHGYGVLATAGGVRVSGHFADGEEMSARGRVTFADDSAGLPCHEGDLRQRSGLVRTEKCPAEVELGLQHATMAEKVERAFLGKGVDSLASEGEEVEDDPALESSLTTNLDDNGNVDDESGSRDDLQAELELELQGLSDAGGSSDALGSQAFLLADTEGQVAAGPADRAFDNAAFGSHRLRMPEDE